MLPALIIGFREGLEATIIVSIIFLYLFKIKADRKIIVYAFVGVGAAFTLSLLTGVVLTSISAGLSEETEETFSFVSNIIAVMIITYVIIWVAKRSANIAEYLQRELKSALSKNKGLISSIVAVCFFAVLREGMETVMLMISFYNNGKNGVQLLTSGVLGVMGAVVFGVLMNLGLIKISPKLMFKFTGVLLLLINAGLCMNIMRSLEKMGLMKSVNILNIHFLESNKIIASWITGIFSIHSTISLLQITVWIAYILTMVSIVKIFKRQSIASLNK